MADRIVRRLSSFTSSQRFCTIGYRRGLYLKRRVHRFPAARAWSAGPGSSTVWSRTHTLWWFVPYGSTRLVGSGPIATPLTNIVSTICSCPPPRTSTCKTADSMRAASTLFSRSAMAQSRAKATVCRPFMLTHSSKTSGVRGSLAQRDGTTKVVLCQRPLLRAPVETDHHGVYNPATYAECMLPQHPYGSRE